MAHKFGEETDLISQRAEIFRSKLISDFHLLEMISEGGVRTEAPTLYTADIADEEKLGKLLLHRPQALVCFHLYHKKAIFSNLERRRNRLKNKKNRNPPIDLWANWVVESGWFQNFILALILINSVVLGIQAEIADKKDSNKTLILVLDIFDYFALLCFVIEIILKWLDNFKDFWKNRWNIFDFFVTFLSFIPEIITYSNQNQTEEGATGALTVVAENLRTFRVLRSLKMVSRFQKVRLIVLAVTKAFQAMVFITLLLFIFAYIFAIIGVIFLNYSAFEGQLMYQNSFNTIVDALITLFQLFTLDHWLDIFKDVRIVAGQGFAALYVILWIVIGSFIIRNIVVGIMVNNFQSIRNELFEEVGEIHDREKRDQDMEEFAEELDRQNARRHSLEEGHEEDENHVESIRTMAAASKEGSEPAPQTIPNTQSAANVGLHRGQSQFKSVDELKDAMDQNCSKAEIESDEWQAIVEKNLENLAREEACFCWPKDSLFKYFLMLETLQENIKERQELLHMACEALAANHDT